MLEGDISLEGLSPKEDPTAREYPGAAQRGRVPRVPERARLQRRRGRRGTPGDAGGWRLPGDLGAHEGPETGTPVWALGTVPRTAPRWGRTLWRLQATGGTHRRGRAGVGPGAPRPCGHCCRPARAVPVPGEHPRPCGGPAGGGVSDVFTGAINTQNVSGLLWRFICDIK